MQDIHGIFGGGGGGSGGPIFGDRRLRAAAAQGDHHQQALKCPRCDSSNTKFCYYNNYNLSQPRHFCKDCRRYWTNGGVLRNVPVGGGCRKSKRSSKRKASSPAPPPSSAAANDRQDKSNSRSSSESTSANTAAKDRSTGGCVGPGKASDAVAMVAESGSEFSSSPLFKFAEQLPAFSTVQAPTKPDFEPLNDPGGIATANSGGSGIFTEFGGFASYMSDQNHNLFGFGSGGDVEPAPFRIHQQNRVNLRHENPTAEDWQSGDHWGTGMLDQTVHADLLPSSRSTAGGVVTGSDWDGVSGGRDGGVGGGRGHLGNLLDLTPGSSGGHWSQSADQWHESDHDHRLYLPP